jgi:hypothetical protein
MARICCMGFASLFLANLDNDNPFVCVNKPTVFYSSTGGLIASCKYHSQALSNRAMMRCMLITESVYDCLEAQLMGGGGVEDDVQ